MARIEAGPDTVVVEGELPEEACEELEEALDALRGSRITLATVDLSRVTTAASKPVGLVFALWLDLFRQGRVLDLVAPGHVWDVLGRAGVDQMFMKKPAPSMRIGQTR